MPTQPQGCARPAPIFDDTCKQCTTRISAATTATKTTTTTNYTEAGHRTGDKGPRKAQPTLCQAEAPVPMSTLTLRNHQMAKWCRCATSKPVTVATHHQQPLTGRSMCHHHHLCVGTATARAACTSTQRNLCHCCTPPPRRCHDGVQSHPM